MISDEEVELDDLIELSYLAEDSDVSSTNANNSQHISNIDNVAKTSEISEDNQSKQLDLDSLANLSCDDNNLLDTCDITNQASKSDSDVLSPHIKSQAAPRILKDISIDSLLEKGNVPKTSNSEDKKNVSTFHSGDTDSSDDEIDRENKLQLSETGRMIKKRIAVQKSYEKPQRLTIKTWKDKEKPPVSSVKKIEKKESYMVEEFSGLRIVNPVVSRDFLRERMIGRRLVKMSDIQKNMKNGDIDGDWVTIGVVVSKLPPKTTRNGKTYSIWRMCDKLEAQVFTSVFLFGKAHTDHWKMSIGTVLGILNPSILPDQEASRACVSLSVDHPGKILIFGASKDYGICKAITKNGAACTSVINKSKGDFCNYHLSKEYKKFSLMRTEFSGPSRLGVRQPDFKTKVLKGENFMYGGQMFCTPTRSASQPKSKTSKDKFILSNLNPLKRKADILDLEEQNKKPTKIQSSNPGAANQKVTESKFIDERLSAPTPGSRNLLQHLVNVEKVKKAENKTYVSVTPKELLKKHERELQLKREEYKAKTLARSNSLPTHLPQPKIGIGYKPGDEICLDMKPNLKNHLLSKKSEIAKVKAIQKIMAKGPLQPKNPNAVKTENSPEQQAKIKNALEKSLENGLDKSLENGLDKSVTGKTEQIKKPENPKKEILGMLGSINISSEKMKKLLGKKSNHYREVEMMDEENNEIYFNALEKKEQMEEKMMTTKEIVCSVVSCKLCDYTAEHATERCRNEQHPLKVHKAVKKFFSCTDCKRRTFCFTKLPKRACRGCGGSSFEKTGMMKPRSGPKLDSEILVIRGEERKFVNS